MKYIYHRFIFINLLGINLFKFIF